MDKFRYAGRFPPHPVFHPMSRVLIIGAGGVSRVVVHKCAQLPERIRGNPPRQPHHVQMRRHCRRNEREVRPRSPRPTGSMPTTWPSWSRSSSASSRRWSSTLPCPTRISPSWTPAWKPASHYLDTANYEPPDTAKFEYKWQWAYQERFKQAGLMALLGCGFDPGVTTVFTAHALKHHFKEIHTLDIVDVQCRRPWPALRHEFQSGNQHPRNHRRLPPL